MNKSSRSIPKSEETALAGAAAEWDLEFPIAPDFDSRPPQLSLPDFVQWCEEMMELTPINRDNPDRRFQEKAGLEFVM